MADLSGVRAVLFDAVGTLIRPRPAVADVYRSFARRHGSGLGVETILRRFRAAFAAQEALDRDDPVGATSESRERARWQQIVADVFPEVPTVDALFEQLWDHFAAPSAWSIDPEVPQVLQAIRNAGLQVGIASNFDSRLRNICEANPDLAGCELFISSELGFRKPTAGFFRVAARRVDLPGDRILLVGDDPANDYEGARAAGWHAVLLDRDDRGAAGPPFDAYQGRPDRIAALRDVLDLLHLPF